MQNALAIISFPLTAVETPPPSAESTNQGFALAFEQGLIAPEDEAPSLDAMAAGPVLPPFWSGPPPSIAAIVPSGVTDDTTASPPETDLAIVPETVPPDFSPLVPVPSGADLDAEEAPAMPGGAIPDLLQVAVAPGGPGLGAEAKPEAPTGAIPISVGNAANASLPGKLSVDLAGPTPGDVRHSEPPLDAMSDKAPVGSFPAETQGLPLQFLDANDSVPVTANVASDAAEATKVPAQGVDGNPPQPTTQIAVSVPDFSDQSDTAMAVPNTQSKPSLARLGSAGSDFEPSDPDTMVKDKADPALAVEPTRTPQRSSLTDVVEKQSQPSFDLPTTTSPGPVAQPASFWERFFAGVAAPRDRAGQQGDRPEGPEPVNVASSAVVAGTAAALHLGAAAKLNSRPAVELQSEDPPKDAVREVPAERPLPETKVAASPFQPGQPVPAVSAPLVFFTDWDASLVESREQVDLAPLSGPVLQSGSGYSVASGPQGPTSFPVQQVAAQLSGVLVNVSDKGTELALAPEELGRVSLRLEPDAANPDRMTILINVERPETLELFRRHAGELADAIKAAGYSGADIGFGQQGQGGSPDHKPDENAFGSGQPPEDQTPVTPPRRDVVGATLDLRL